MEQYRKSPRANFLSYDYGVFFVTICTKDKKHYFGTISNGKMNLSEIGRFLDTQLAHCNEFCPNIEMIQYVIMPNHIHAIVKIDTKLSDIEIETGQIQRNPNPSLRADSTSQRHVPALSKYINSMKGTVSKYAKENNIEFGWQARFHDHLIRGIHDGNNISEYISNNIAKWQHDCYY